MPTYSTDLDRTNERLTAPYGTVLQPVPGVEEFSFDAFFPSLKTLMIEPHLIIVKYIFWLVEGEDRHWSKPLDFAWEK